MPDRLVVIDPKGILAFPESRGLCLWLSKSSRMGTVTMMTGFVAKLAIS
jgi:hypothetical protein